MNRLTKQVNWAYGILAAVTHVAFGYITYLRLDTLPPDTLGREWPIYILMYLAGLAAFCMFYLMSLLFATIDGD